jgi:hypothetical protein
MTAINVIRQAEAVHIISDGVFCDSNGVVCEIIPNTWLLPHLPAAIGIHGPPHLMPFLVHRLSRECPSFDDIAAKIVGIALEVHISFPMTYGTLGLGSVNPEFDLIAAGWSEARHRPVSYLVTCQRRGPGTQGDWEVIELSDSLIAPPISERLITAVNWKLPKSAQAFRADVDGIKLLQAQRLTQGLINPKDPAGGHGFLVGGFIQLTSVFAHGVSSRILHRWPDQIGRRIEPQGRT